MTVNAVPLVFAQINIIILIENWCLNWDRKGSRLPEQTRNLLMQSSMYAFGSFIIHEYKQIYKTPTQTYFCFLVRILQIYHYAWMARIQTIIKPLQQIIMIEQIEAQNNLASLSQKTNYIQDWTDKKFQKYRQAEKDTISEQCEQPTKPTYQTKRQKQIMKEVSEKYDLRKCQKKLSVINEVQLPLPHRNLFKLQESYKLPKHLYQQPKQSAPNILRRKGNSIHSYKCAEGQFLKRRLQIFQRKNIQSQKDLHSRRLNSKLPSLPRLFEEKRNEKFQFKKKKPLVSEQEIEKIKRAITKQSKRYSVPLLISEAQGLPLIKGLLH